MIACTTALRQTRRAFTLVELIAVIVVLAILSAVAIPKYFDYSAKAKESAVKGTLGAVRSAIANFYANTAVNGSAAFPTLAELEANGTVLQDAIPTNPYLAAPSNDVAAATWNASNPPVSGTNGWNYDVAAGKFWANSDTSGVDENTW
jgi:prepilin-type N-terminal cleavage/methylation domain-containing protein